MLYKTIGMLQKKQIKGVCQVTVMLVYQAPMHLVQVARRRASVRSAFFGIITACFFLHDFIYVDNVNDFMRGGGDTMKIMVECEEGASVSKEKIQ